MGLTSFSGTHPTKNDIGIAKNFLSDAELSTLNRMVSAFFDLADLRAMQHKPMYMKDWVLELDDFAERYGNGILKTPVQSVIMRRWKRQTPNTKNIKQK